MEQKKFKCLPLYNRLDSIHRYVSLSILHTDKEEALSEFNGVILVSQKHSRRVQSQCSEGCGLWRVLRARQRELESPISPQA